MRIRAITILGIFTALIIGGIIGFQLKKYQLRARFRESPPPQLKVLRQNDDTYKYINPVLAFYMENSRHSPNLKPLQEKIKNYIDEVKTGTKAKSVGVYFREMNSGRWTGVNEDEKFAPASMLKVFLMIAYFGRAELDGSTLEKKLFYDGTVDHNESAYFRPPQSLTGNAWYTVAFLIERMITESGNNSYVLLVKNLGEDKFENIFNTLELPMPETTLDIDFMSPKSYSFAFRVLYNSTYLSRTLSEKALALLTQTQFNKGLVAGVPKKIAVAHKFGERSLDNAPIAGAVGSKELHDCGIIYVLNNPYFLCVMTKGDSFDDLAEVIAGISELVYEETSKPKE